MASFRIHEDQENTTSLALRKDNADIYAGATQRRALGDLNQFPCTHNRNIKVFPSVPKSGALTKVSDENKIALQLKNDKNIAPPVAQFKAFSVYEDRPIVQQETRKREPFKPFTIKDVNVQTENLNVENSKPTLKGQTLQIESKHVQQRKPLQDQKILPHEEKVVLPEESDKDKNESSTASPMSVGLDASVLSAMSITNSSILEDEEEKVQARTDRDMFFHVAEYRDDIYQYMRQIEVKHRPHPRYMRKQQDITSSMRAILVDWLAEVCEEYSQQSETLHLAVSYVDRFLSYMSVVRAKLQLVGTAATFIAAKFEEVYPPEVGDFVYITDDTYSRREVLRMEHLMLKVLSFDLSTPTSLAFLSHLAIKHSLSTKMFHLAAYIAELSLLEADPYLQWRPSLVAAGALATARHCLLCPRCNLQDGGVLDARADAAPHALCLAAAWTPELEESSSYALGELEPVMRELCRTHAHAQQQQHVAIPDKYKNNKFDKVATIDPKPMFPITRPIPAQNPADKKIEPQPDTVKAAS